VDHTFETQFVEVTKEDAQQFIDLYKAHQNQSLETGQPSLPGSLLPVLSANLQKTMDAIGDAEYGCFVKTSSRSAKDHANLAQLKSRFQNALQKVTHKASSAVDENAKLIAMSYASMELLRMYSCEQVLSIFSQSERIWHDMELALAPKNPEQEMAWEESIAVRKWVNIEPDMEFRCFVYNGRLTAISQYRHLVHFPRLVANQDPLLKAMVAFFDVVRPNLFGSFPEDDYILDLAVELQPGCDGEGILGHEPFQNEAEPTIKKIWIVEVNPFYETTDGCMYSWKHDWGIISGTAAAGSVSVDLRLRSAPARGASSLIYGAWKDILTQTANATESCTS
jgi:hypothetical protein